MIHISKVESWAKEKGWLILSKRAAEEKGKMGIPSLAWGHIYYLLPDGTANKVMFGFDGNVTRTQKVNV